MKEPLKIQACVRRVQPLRVLKLPFRLPKQTWSVEQLMLYDFFHQTHSVPEVQLLYLLHVNFLPCTTLLSLLRHDLIADLRISALACSVQLSSQSLWNPTLHVRDWFWLSAVNSYAKQESAEGQYVTF